MTFGKNSTILIYAPIGATCKACHKPNALYRIKEKGVAFMPIHDYCRACFKTEVKVA